MKLAELSTPAALIDHERMLRNIDRMQAQVNSRGVAFRPHVKTSKCVAVADLQRQAGANGITVSTLKEAEQFFSAGFTDILYAVGIVESKLKQAAALLARGCKLVLLVDNLTAAQAVVAYGLANRLRFELLIEIDTDGHRSGVDPRSENLLQIGRCLHDGGQVLAGVMTHAGASYACSSTAELQAIAEQERSLCVLAAQNLRAAGLPCSVVSVGSTPTALSARDLSGVTEVRAGVYVFFDLVMANVGVCSPQDIALSVLTTVIGHQPEKGWVIVDAGWMAMSRDRGTASQARDFGYGQVCDLAGQVIDGFVITGANQEHGIVSRTPAGPDPKIAEQFPIGSLWRILPNHACATAAQFPQYHCVSQDAVVGEWDRFYGW